MTVSIYEPQPNLLKKKLKRQISQIFFVEFLHVTIHLSIKSKNVHPLDCCAWQENLLNSHNENETIINGFKAAFSRNIIASDSSRK